MQRSTPAVEPQTMNTHSPHYEHSQPFLQGLSAQDIRKNLMRSQKLYDDYLNDREYEDDEEEVEGCMARTDVALMAVSMGENAHDPPR